MTSRRVKLLIIIHIIFINLFSIVSHQCKLPPTMRATEVLNHFHNITIREVKNCAAKSKRSWCFSSYAVCSFDRIKKVWKYLPICQETCKSYENLKPCAKLLLKLNQVIKDVVKYCKHVEIFLALDCTRYPKYKSDNCFYLIPGRLIDFVIMIFLFKRSDYWSCVSVKKWCNLVRKKRKNVN